MAFFGDVISDYLEEGVLQGKQETPMVPCLAGAEALSVEGVVEEATT